MTGEAVMNMRFTMIADILPVMDDKYDKKNTTNGNGCPQYKLHCMRNEMGLATKNWTVFLRSYIIKSINKEGIIRLNKNNEENLVNTQKNSNSS
ncbi:MAG: hypothetical protein UHU19_09200 [Lachnospiraceae bacterium]|nr:hypothetical protein [Lachnospiraceae bacterium]